MLCDTCKTNEATCDDYCVTCEIAFYASDPLEADDIIRLFKSNPQRFAEWEPVVRTLGG